MPSPAPHSASQSFVTSLWIGVVGPPASWAAHLQVVYVLVPPVGRGRPYALLYGTTAACFALAVLCGLMSFRAWLRVRDQPFDLESSNLAGCARFLSLLGVFSSVLFAIAIVAAGATSFFFDARWC